MGAWNARRDVVVNHIGHAVFIHQTVAGRKIDSGFPFLGADFTLEVFEIGRKFAAHVVLLILIIILMQEFMIVYVEYYSAMPSDKKVISASFQNRLI
jgi:hypothetical protein